MAIKNIAKFSIVLIFSLWAQLAYCATLLPPAEQTFFDANGKPLAYGNVYFYIPNTTNQKQTWKDSDQTVLNTNPVSLDAGGRAIIYGSGIYRQIVKDSLGNLIWDQTTADSSSTFYIYGGVSTGNASAQVLNASNFLGTPGQSISFIAGFTNGGPITLTVGTTTYPAVVDTPIGPKSLVGGEIISGNNVIATLDTNSVFHITPSVRSNPIANVSVASTTDIGSTGQNDIRLYGGGTINSFGSSASTNSPYYDIYFQSAVTVIKSSNILQFQNIVFSTGDSARYAYDGNGIWHLVSYQTALGNIATNGIANTGNISNSGNSTNGGYLTVGNVTYLGGTSPSAPDPLYASPGDIYAAPGSKAKFTNTISARVSVNGSSISNSFNVSSVNVAGTGQYIVSFSNPMQTTAYQVVASAPNTSGVVLLSSASSKTINQFTMTFYTSSGAVTNLNTSYTDIIVTGGN